MQKGFKQFVSEGYDFGVKEPSDLENFQSKLDKSIVLSLLQQLKTDYPNVDYPLALDLGAGKVKVRIKEFDLPTWKAENLPKGMSSYVQIGKGSINKSGGELTGADWECVICACYNMKSKKVSLDEAIKLAEISNWKSKMDTHVDVGFQIVNSAWSNPTGVMKHYGSGTVDLTKEWEQYFLETTGKKAPATTKTPKTDMYIGDQRISLKKAGGSQLMSGGKAEALATLAFTYKSMPSSVKTAEFDSAWKKLEKDVSDKFTKIFVGKHKSTTDIKRDIKAGVKNEITEAVAETMANHTELQNSIRNIFKSLEARREFVRESMTGRNKFSTELAIATHILVFNPDTGKASYKVIDDKLITQYASSLQLQINFKKGGSSSTPYSNLRGTLSDKITEAVDEEEFTKELLQENLMGKVGSFVRGFLRRVLKKVWGKLKSLFSSSYATLLRILGRKPDITKDPKITWKI
jgi:hypothetical protein